ncbi:hypothetical protein NXK88_002849, partial [Enterococcus hirae]|nr:hypothetical protein [Enterococcus hirae]
MFKKRKQLIGWLGLGLFIGGLGCSTDASAMERHAVYFDRNYGGQSMVPKEKELAINEFNNNIDPYQKFQIVDASEPKQNVINALEENFKNSSDDDINYLIFHSHGGPNGIIDFSFKELKDILDQYKGHFVLTLSACGSGGMINKTVTQFKKTFIPKNKIGEFKNTKYTVYCACTKDQSAYNNGQYGFFIKAYFDSSQIGKNGFLNADYNQDHVVTASELGQYLETYGKAGNATPVSQIPEPNLPVFATNRSTFDFNG